MEEWQWISFILCGFGLLKELRPSEPFVTQYIIDYKNVTSQEVIHNIFPISTYTLLGTLVVIFLVTDFLRYRPIIVLQAVSYVFTWIFLIWGHNLQYMQVVQVFYGIAVSADVAYYTYIYAKVRREHYKKVTSYTYSAALIGKFLSGTISQILVSLQLLNFHELNYISLTTLSLALILSILLPKASQSLYFNRPLLDLEEPGPKNRCRQNDDGIIPTTEFSVSQIRITLAQRIKLAYPLLWKDFKIAYRNPCVLKWSVWWALAMAGNLQAQNYIQALWKTIEQENPTSGSTRFNGGVNAIQCLFSAIFSLAIGHVHIHWSKWGEIFLCFVSLIQGLVFMWMSFTNSLPIAYATYVTFRILYQVVITIANAEVAQGINRDSHGLIFGINTFLALVVQSILTLVITDARGLALEERSQFIIYGAYFCVLGLCFFGAATITFFRNYNKRPLAITGLSAQQ